jgi:hypothetical protein
LGIWPRYVYDGCDLRRLAALLLIVKM